MYGGNTIRLPSVKIDHNYKSQKSEGTTRYNVDKSAAEKLLGELIKGHSKVCDLIFLFF